MKEVGLRQWVDANPGRVNDRDVRGEAPLIAAAFKCKSLPLIQWLVNEKWADVNAANKDGGIPLHLTNSIDVVTCLLDCGADPTPPDSLAYTPLMVQTFKSNHHSCTLIGRPACPS
jgi:ankyrin repeat protein